MPNSDGILLPPFVDIVSNFAPNFKKGMNRKLFCALAVCMAVATNVCAQDERKMSIEEMFGLIRQNNKSIQVSKTMVDATAEGVKAARSQRLPDIGAQLSASYIGNVLLTDRNFSNVHGNKSPHFGNQFVLDAQQTIYAGGAINAGIKLAELGAQQAKAELTLSEQNQRFLALGQYLDLEKIAHREQVIKKNITLTQQLIDQIKEKQQQGVALKNDITRYELQMETLQLNLVKLQNTRKILNHQLCNTLGLTAPCKIEPTDDAASAIFGKDGEGYWQTAAGVNSPQLMIAGIGEQMARQQEKIAKSALMPKVAVVAQNNFNGPITFELPPIDKNLNIWYVGIGVQYQLSSLFKSNKKLAQARLETQAATARKAVAAEQLDNNVQAAYTQYMQSYVELETQQKSVELAQRNYNVINDRYLNQLALVTDMVDASNMKLDAELGEVDARINIAYAYYKMKYIAGQL